MVDVKQEPAANGPHSVHAHDEEYQKKYITDTLDKFLNEFVFGNEDIPTTDGVLVLCCKHSKVIPVACRYEG